MKKKLLSFLGSASLILISNLSIAQLKGGDAFSNAFKKDKTNSIEYFYLVAEKNELLPFLEKY